MSSGILNEGKSKAVGQSIVFLIVFAFAFFATKMIFSNGDKKDQAALKKGIVEANKKMPMMVDKVTRYDSISAVNDGLVKYYVTLLNIENESSEVFINTIKEQYQRLAQQNYNTNPELSQFRDNNISVNYYYKNKDGGYIFDFTLKPPTK